MRYIKSATPKPTPKKETPMPILYTTKASATGGRAGHGATEDGEDP